MSEPVATKHVATKTEGAVLTLTFNRPEKKNALTAAMYAEAATVLRKADQDPAVRAAVLTGTGDSFSAGNDLKDFIDNPPTGATAPVWQFMSALSHFTKPVVAAVNGLAIGIGTTALLHCDLAYAVPEAKFQLPFVNLALVPEFASSLLLPRIAGPRAAAELLMLGEAFDAERALSYKLINGIVPASDLMTLVLGKAHALAAKPPAAMRATKALLHANSGEVTEAIAREGQIFAERLASAELKEAVAAFFEKRAPDYSKF